MNRLQNKIALITGAAGGIGLATAKLFLNQGAKVFLTDIDAEAIERAVKELNTEHAAGMKADVSKDEDNRKSVEACVAKFGGLDIFFANAGVEGKVQPLDELSEADFDFLMSVNAKGVWLGIKHAFAAMKNGGSIVINSSVAGLKGTANMMAYTASKHAVIGVMRVAAQEGAPRGIRVNTLNPSPVDNRMMRSLEEGFAPGAGAEVKKSFEQMIPLKRYATNEEIANLALFLSSDESSYITGCVYPIDGGMTA
ncbi:MAG: SDR family oxidoreductase [Flavobacteriales bacterium]|nr:MAG: SDR family oxidoreductase [Flavobacteriales bacterium]